MSYSSACPTSPDRGVVIGHPTRRGQKICSACDQELYPTGNGWAHKPLTSQLFYADSKVRTAMAGLFTLMAGGVRAT
jgi:hypothetical protein